jgi:predicted TIM-barrel enzyme
MGFGTEVEMIRVASEMGIPTTPYVFDVVEAAEKGRGAHMG